VSGVGRRGFIGLAAGAPLAMGALPAWGQRADAGALLILFDPTMAASARLADQVRKHGAAVLALSGDRIRFMRDVVASRPRVIAGMTSYADFLLLSGTAAESGFRLDSHAQHRNITCATHRCFGRWRRADGMLDASADAWPEAMAALMTGAPPSPRTDAANPARPGIAATSWMLRRRA